MIPFLLAICLGSAAPSLVLDDHDYVFPRLSPDGQKLLVARARVRPEGGETTNVVIVDVDSGKAREVVSEALAEENEAWETYVTGLQWKGNERIEVDLSDGDVGGTLLTIDAATGKVLHSHVHSEDDDVRPEVDNVFATIRQVMRVPEGFELLRTVERPGETVFLLASDERVRLHSLRGRRVKLLAEWPLRLRNQCPRIDSIGGRLFLFVRPCARYEPSNGELWEIANGRAARVQIGANVDELSTSADGSRVAIGRWRDGRRIVEVITDCPR